MTERRTYVVLILTSGVLIYLGPASFLLGDHYARQSNDLDGGAAMLGFVMLIGFVGLGLSIGVSAIVLWVLGMGDR